MSGRIIGLATAMVLAGCVVPREAGFPDVKRLVGERTDERVHWRRGTAEDAEVDRVIADLLARPLTAASATQIALLNNSRLQATYERLGVAQADVVQAGLLRNPVAFGHLGFPIGGGFLEWEASLTGSFLDLFLMPIKKKFARAEFERVKLEVSNAVLDVVAEVRTQFVTTQAAAQVVEMRRLVVQAAQAAAELAVRQRAAGNLSDLDVVAEQSQYAEAKLDLTTAETHATLEREHLTRLLGVWGGAANWTVNRLAELPPDDPSLEHLETFAVSHRLDLAAAGAVVATAAAALQLTSSTRIIGGLDAGIQVHRDTDGPRNLGPTIALELPIFDQKQAAIARLHAELRAAQRRRDALAIDVRSEVRSARTRMLAARATVDYYGSTLIPLRERNVALAQVHYNAMLLGVYQLLQAKRAEVNTYREYIEAVRDYWIARAELDHAAGARIPDEKQKTTSTTAPPAEGAAAGAAVSAARQGAQP